MLPTNLEKTRTIIEATKDYKDKHSFYTPILFIYTYVFLQSFAIPGPLLLSLISGALWGLFYGFLINLTCVTLGSTMSYTISSVLIQDIIIKKWPHKVMKFKF